MAEMGGFAKTIFASIAVFLAPLTQFTFYTSTIQHLFMKMEQKEKKQKSKQDKLTFFEDDNNIPQSLKDDNEFMEKVHKTDQVYLSIIDKVKLLLVMLQVKLCFFKKFKSSKDLFDPKSGKLYKTYAQGKL